MEPATFYFLLLLKFLKRGWIPFLKIFIITLVYNKPWLPILNKNSSSIKCSMRLKEVDKIYDINNN